MDDQEHQMGPPFALLTEKQQEVLSLLADGRTSKEISFALHISESAVNQRIEMIRSRFDGLPRNEIVRRYRRWLTEQDATCNNLTGEKIQLSARRSFDNHWPQEAGGASLELADVARFELRSPWQINEPNVVPEALDGPDASLKRVLEISKIAAGISVALLTLLAVGNALSNLLR